MKNILHIVCIFVTLSGVANAEQFAFLVGVKDYRGGELTSLRYTERDVTELGSMLTTAMTKAGVAPWNLTVLTHTSGKNKPQLQPTALNIQTQLQLLAKRLTPEDTLLVAFSGHGVQFKDEEETYFCPADATLGDKSSLLSLSKIYAFLDRECRASVKVMLVDACRNDPRPAGAKAGNAIELDPAGVIPVDPPGGLIAFYSCSRGETSHEHLDIEHGVFLKSVLEAFNGDADANEDRLLSIDEMQNYCSARTTSLARSLAKVKQTPEMKATLRGPVVLCPVPRPLPIGLIMNLGGLKQGEIPKGWTTEGTIGFLLAEGTPLLGRMGAGVILRPDVIRTSQFRLSGDFNFQTEIVAPDGGIFDFKFVDQGGTSTTFQLQCGRPRFGAVRDWSVTAGGSRVRLAIMTGSETLTAERSGALIRVKLGKSPVANFRVPTLKTIDHIEISMTPARDPAGLKSLEILPPSLN